MLAHVAAHLRFALHDGWGKSARAVEDPRSLDLDDDDGVRALGAGLSGSGDGTGEVLERFQKAASPVLRGAPRHDGDARQVARRADGCLLIGDEGVAWVYVGLRRPAKRGMAPSTS